MGSVRSFSRDGETTRERLLQSLSRMDTPKRLEALLHERVFGQKIVELCGEANVSLGWCFTFAEYSENIRNWFRILFPGEELNDVDRAFHDRLHSIRSEDRFYVLRVLPDRSVRNLTDRLSCVEWIRQGEREEPNLVQKLVSEARRRKSSFRCDSGGLDGLALRKRFEQLNFDELYNETFRRLLMNEYLVYASDLDAVVLRDDELMIFEYKRKPPARGMLPLKQPDSPFLSTRELKQITYALKKQIEKRLAFDSRKGLHFTEVFQLLTQYSTISEHVLDTKRQDICFGLDLSHASTVEACEESGIRYCYLILDSEEKRATELLDLEGNYIDGLKFRHLQLTMASFAGLTFTDGHDSGSYDKRVRLQLCIPASHFTQVSGFGHALNSCIRA